MRKPANMFAPCAEEIGPIKNVESLVSAVTNALHARMLTLPNYTSATLVAASTLYVNSCVPLARMFCAQTLTRSAQRRFLEPDMTALTGTVCRVSKHSRLIMLYEVAEWHGVHPFTHVAVQSADGAHAVLVPCCVTDDPQAVCTVLRKALKHKRSIHVLRDDMVWDKEKRLLLDGAGKVVCALSVEKMMPENVVHMANVIRRTRKRMPNTLAFLPEHVKAEGQRVAPQRIGTQLSNYMVHATEKGGVVYVEDTKLQHLDALACAAAYCAAVKVKSKDPLGLMSKWFEERDMTLEECMTLSGLKKNPKHKHTVAVFFYFHRLRPRLAQAVFDKLAQCVVFRDIFVPKTKAGKEAKKRKRNPVPKPHVVAKHEVVERRQEPALSDGSVDERCAEMAPESARSTDSTGGTEASDFHSIQNSLDAPSMHLPGSDDWASSDDEPRKNCARGVPKSNDALYSSDEEAYMSDPQEGSSSAKRFRLC
ncbi:ORF90 [Ranid herpesvirus 1]|uniref:ORF90 n=1 Tax=Ranid herpesvirus 1 TaxID=85655 RepID=Q14VP0_9VIRU|nr:ORF90 [Ranid herpesvirus 1]ABG25730.1 ORF90 [Ranid herpesvirus 1]